MLCQLRCYDVSSSPISGDPPVPSTFAPPSIFRPRTAAYQALPILVGFNSIFLSRLQDEISCSLLFELYMRIIVESTDPNRLTLYLLPRADFEPQFTCLPYMETQPK